jgi:hypothetical protein
MLGKITSYLSKVNPIFDTQASVLGTFPRHPTLDPSLRLLMAKRKITKKLKQKDLCKFTVPVSPRKMGMANKIPRAGYR